MKEIIYPSRGFKEKSKKYKDLNTYEKKLKIHAIENKRLHNLPYVFRGDVHVGGYRVIIEKIPIMVRNKLYYFYYLHSPLKHEEYDKVIKDKSDTLHYLENRRPTRKERREIKKIITSKPPPPPIPPIPEEYKKWLVPHTLQYDLHPSEIFETREWIANIKKDKTLGAAVCRKLLEIYDTPTKKVASGIHRSIEIAETEDFYLLYEKYYKTNHNPSFDQTDKPLMLLYYIGFKKQDEDYLAEAERIKKRYAGEGIFNKTYILRNAKRGYGGLFLTDEEAWIKIQGLTESRGAYSEEANLALSPEESDLLRHKVLYKDENNMERPFYPLFINGHAGSGKSTMLFYLAAHFATLGLKGRPLFLTYNAVLLERAKQDITVILNTHQDYLLKHGGQPVEDLNIEMHTFQDFIIRKLIPMDERSRFKKDNYISFHKFKTCYAGGFWQNHLNYNMGRRQFSEEVVWHVIRAYIKGHDHQCYLTPDAYAQIDKSDRTVKQATYEYIYYHIWEKWYKNLWAKKEQWDDQDLVRCALATWEQGKKPTYPALFCDEAQDFTRSEVELLFKLSLFSKYDLSNEKILPIVFGGDPYQTLNPTGFRWEALRSMFVNKFKAIGFKHIKLENQTLSYNYRSEKNIVRFANLVTFYRFLASMRDKNLRPQIPWQDPDRQGLKPCLFEIGKSIKAENIKNALVQNTLFIVPADGKEQEMLFVEKDAILSEWLAENSNNKIPNIMSTVTAKGLEFRRIILYKFGEYMPIAFEKICNGEPFSQNEKLKLGYFINKLYVAITRAKEQLYVIDTPVGIEQFWKKYFVKPPSQLATITDFVELIAGDKFLHWDFNCWNYSEDFEFLLVGTSDTMNNIIEDDPEKNAIEFEEKGKALQDAELLMRASVFYQKLGKDKKSHECLGWAAFHQSNWQLAGDYFKQAEDLAKAEDCYWEGQCWDALQQLPQMEGEAHQVRRMVATYMIRQISYETILQKSQDIILAETASEHKSWQDFGNRLNKDLKKVAKKTMQTSKLRDIAYKVEQLATGGIAPLFETIGICYFKIREYEAAIEAWEKINLTETVDYYRARERTAEKKDDKIEWLGKMLPKLSATLQIIHQEILNLWKATPQNQQVNFSEVARYQVFDSLIVMQELTTAVEMPIALAPKIDKLLAVLDDSTPISIKPKLMIKILKDGERDLYRRHFNAFKYLLHDRNAIDMYLLTGIPFSNIVFCAKKTPSKTFDADFIGALVQVVTKSLRANKFMYLKKMLSLLEEWKKETLSQETTGETTNQPNLTKTPEYRYKFVKIISALIASDIQRNMTNDEFIDINNIISDELFEMRYDKKRNNDYVHDIRPFYHLNLKKNLELAERLRFKFLDLKAAYSLILEAPEKYGVKHRGMKWVQIGFLKALYREKQNAYNKGNPYYMLELELQDKMAAWEISESEIRRTF